MNESDIQSGIIDYLTIHENLGKLMLHRSNNGAVFDKNRYRSRAKGQKKGFPDILVLMNGKSIGLEVKKPKPKKTYQSKDQKEFEKQWVKNGGEYYVVRSIQDVVYCLGFTV